MEKRANILALASKISLEGLTYTGVTYNDPEYRILAPIVDDDMCAVMMHMRLETPRNAADISRRCNKDLNFVQKQLDKLREAGIARTRNIDGDVYYFNPGSASLPKNPYKPSWGRYSGGLLEIVALDGEIIKSMEL